MLAAKDKTLGGEIDMKQSLKRFLMVAVVATAALFTFVVPFLISTVGGTIMAIVITMTMKKTKVLAKFQQQINS